LSSVYDAPLFSKYVADRVLLTYSEPNIRKSKWVMQIERYGTILVFTQNNGELQLPAKSFAHLHEAMKYIEDTFYK